MNKAIISGEVSSYGPKISWTDAGKPQTSLTLVLEKAGYKTFIPVLVVGTKAEEVAETINGGDYLIVEGSLAWRAGRTKESGKLHVVAFDVERLTESAQDERSPSPDYPEQGAKSSNAPGGDERPLPKKRTRYPGQKSALQN